MSVPSDSQRMEKIVSLCKRRGFIFQSSEIYGGLNGLWDYGPLGVELKRNLKNYWWRVMVHERDDVVGMDGSILMNRAVWKASGHEDTFTDPMVDCRSCKARLRVDQITEKKIAVRNRTNRQGVSQRNQSAQFHFSLARVRTDGAGIFLPGRGGDEAARILERRAIQVLREHRHRARQIARADRAG